MSMVFDTFKLGDDALANLWEISFAPFDVGPQVEGLTDNLFRRIEEVSIPEVGVDTYEVYYKSIKFTKPKARSTMENEFTFTYSVDNDYALYKAFTLWQNQIFNQVTGKMGADEGLGLRRIPLISVQACDRNGVPLTGTEFGKWNFYGCFIQNHEGISFGYEDDDPIKCEVTIHYLTMSRGALTEVI